ncbi:MAG: hypothetical protein HQL99_06920 [Magnetococcales bacterium]|nr:hypothetical protein [Magnetococcales bacterium]
MKKSLLMVAVLLGLGGGVATVSAADLSARDLSGLSRPLMLASVETDQAVVDEDQSTVLDKKKKKKKKKIKKNKPQRTGAHDAGAGAGSAPGQWDPDPIR